MSVKSIADDYLFVGTRGHVVALRKSDGEVLWKVSLPKTGYEVVTIIVEDGALLCASRGRAFALDPADGRILWENTLKGLGHGLVALATTQHATDQVAALAAQKAKDDARARE